MKKTFFVSLFIGVPDKTYAGLPDLFKRITDGDYEIVHLHQTGAFFLLNTEKGPVEIRNLMKDFMRSDDRLIILEHSGEWDTWGLNKAAYWLHRPRGQI